MTLIASALIFALQVGPNPAIGNTIGAPDELRNRSERPNRRGRDQNIEQNPDALWLAQCLSLLPEEAARAHTLAQVERNETSGRRRILANHCLGLAATELGLWEDAIGAFTAARDETPQDEARAIARFGTMAGNAALAARDLARAESILTQASTDAQNAASASLQAIIASDLARLLVALERPEEALAQLDRSTVFLPEEANTWLLKATLLRRLERLEEAQSAVEQAGSLAPANAPIGLEAGLIAVLSGREEAARASWQSVIDLAPESPEALTAQDYLAQIGAEPDSETGSGT